MVSETTRMMPPEKGFKFQEKDSLWSVDSKTTFLGRAETDETEEYMITRVHQPFHWWNIQ